MPIVSNVSQTVTNVQPSRRSRTLNMILTLLMMILMILMMTIIIIYVLTLYSLSSLKRSPWLRDYVALEHVPHIYTYRLSILCCTRHILLVVSGGKAHAQGVASDAAAGRSIARKTSRHSFRRCRHPQTTSCGCCCRLEMCAWGPSPGVKRYGHGNDPGKRRGQETGGRAYSALLQKNETLGGRGGGRRREWQDKKSRLAFEISVTSCQPTRLRALLWTTYVLLARSPQRKSPTSHVL